MMTCRRHDCVLFDMYTRRWYEFSFCLKFRDVRFLLMLRTIAPEMFNSGWMGDGGEILISIIAHSEFGMLPCNSHGRCRMGKIWSGWLVGWP